METQSSYGDRPPWTRPGFLAAAATIILLLVMAVVIAVASGQSTPDRSGGRAEQAPTPDAVHTDVPPAIPSTAPDDVTWTALGQRILPYSKTAGPANVTATTATGYAHTPTGALIAAAQISSRSGLSAGKDIYEPAVLNQMVPSADRDTLLAALQAAPQEPAAPGELSTLAGFRYVTYGPDTAAIELVRRSAGPQGGYQIARYTMAWDNGDWKMHAPPGGSWLSVTHVASDLSGVVEWGPR